MTTTKGETSTTNTEDIGTVLIDGQPLDEGGLPFDMTIRLDTAGRSQFTKALLSGIDSIEVYGTFGEVYTLTLQSIEGDPLDICNQTEDDFDERMDSE